MDITDLLVQVVSKRGQTLCAHTVEGGHKCLGEFDVIDMQIVSGDASIFCLPDVLFQRLKRTRFADRRKIRLLHRASKDPVPGSGSPAGPLID